MKIAINRCYGGFSPSARAYERYFELKGRKVWFYKQTKYHFNKGGKDELTKIDAESFKKPVRLLI